MNNVQRAVRSFARKHPHAVLVATAVVAVASLAAVETSGILPLEGQATPMYGPLPTRTTRASSSASKKPSLAETRRNARATSAASASLKGAASSSTAKRWTGDECSGSNRTSARCLEKRLAAANGDMSCFADADCYDQTRFCSGLSNADCEALRIRRWAYDAFFPGCTTDECAAGATVLASAKAPKPLKECLASPLCRELLADFRRGEFACRWHLPCLNALAALTADASCGTLPWCNAIKTIDELYTKDGITCKDGATAACMKLIGVDRFASKEPRRVECRRDTACEDAAELLATSLGTGGSYPAQDAGCFLWAPCKESFKTHMDWACRPAINRQPMCSNYSAVWKFLTVSHAHCVKSGDASNCRNALKKLIVR